MNGRAGGTVGGRGVCLSVGAPTAGLARLYPTPRTRVNPPEAGGFPSEASVTRNLGPGGVAP